jgi:hypothetical protein
MSDRRAHLCRVDLLLAIPWQRRSTSLGAQHSNQRSIFQCRSPPSFLHRKRAPCGEMIRSARPGRWLKTFAQNGGGGQRRPRWKIGRSNIDPNIRQIGHLLRLRGGFLRYRLRRLPGRAKLTSGADGRPCAFRQTSSAPKRNCRLEQ